MINLIEEINLILSDEETKLSDGAYRALTFIKDSLFLHIEEVDEIEPVAWMSPNKEKLEFSRKDTVYGSNTIPLYTKQYTRPYTGERIVCAALKDHGDNIYHGYHHEQIYFDCDLEGKNGVVEGFVTTKNGRFVDREEAWLIAEQANQIIHRNVGVKGSLFCENIY